MRTEWWSWVRVLGRGQGWDTPHIPDLVFSHLVLGVGRRQESPVSHLLSQGGREVAPERHFQCILDEVECGNCGHCTRLASANLSLLRNGTGSGER